jgi:hypothetical protein
MHFGPDFSTVQPVPFAALVHDQPREAGEQQTGRRAFLARTHRRRFACLRAAAEALDVLPGEGESLHGVMTGLYDLMHLVVCLLQRFDCLCVTMRIATLSLSARNVQEMVALLDAGSVGRLDLLASDFFKRHEKDIMAELLKEFSERGQRVAIARSHCKVVTMALVDGRRYVLEGSANLRTNKNAEQFCLSRYPALHRWYDVWLSQMVTRYEVKENHAAKANCGDPPPSPFGR